MKKMKKNLFLSLIAGSLIFISCSTETTKKDISEEELGYRKTNIYNEDASLDQLPENTSTLPGSAENIRRAFENAPPLIPHSVNGFYPIKLKANLCISCHMPEMADSLGATSMPRSHFTNYRPKHDFKDGKFKRSSTKNVMVSKYLGKEMYLGRYNCSQCHVPQTDVKLKIQNHFKAVYRKLDDKTKSNFDEVINDGVK